MPHSKHTHHRPIKPQPIQDQDSFFIEGETIWSRAPRIVRPTPPLHSPMQLAVSAATQTASEAVPRLLPRPGSCRPLARGIMAARRAPAARID